MNERDEAIKELREYAEKLSDFGIKFINEFFKGEPKMKYVWLKDSLFGKKDEVIEIKMIGTDVMCENRFCVGGGVFNQWILEDWIAKKKLREFWINISPGKPNYAFSKLETALEQDCAERVHVFEDQV